MTQTIFDAAKFVEFDLSRGVVSAAGRERVALIPLEVLAELSPKGGFDIAAKAWGKLHGQRLKETLAGSLESTGIEALVEHLGGTTAVLGLGSLDVEIFGDALLFRVRTHEDKAVNSGRPAILSGFIAGYLQALVESDFVVADIKDGSEDILLLAGNAGAISLVRAWIDEGIQPFEAIRRLSKRRL